MRRFFVLGVTIGTLVQVALYLLDHELSGLSWPLAYAGFAAVTVAGLAASYAVRPAWSAPVRGLVLGLPFGIPVGFLLLMAWAVATGTFR